MFQIENFHSFFDLKVFYLFTQMSVKVAATSTSYARRYSDFSLLVLIVSYSFVTIYKKIQVQSSFFVLFSDF